MDSKQTRKSYPGMWRLPRDPNRCCIYRVPKCIRDVNPEAYTPQLLLIGPLHRSLIYQARKSLDRGDDITYTKSMGYLNMEEHKKFFFGFVQITEGEKTIDEFRGMIIEDEEKIRASYSESTDWMQSPEFVEMVLHDSFFILIFIQNSNLSNIYRDAMFTDPLTQPCLRNTVTQDLLLLENQLPYFILEKLALKIFKTQITFPEMITSFFGCNGKITNNSKFKHITDMFRCIHVETLPKQDVPKQDEENQTLPKQDEENQTLPQQDEENQTLPQQDEENQTLSEQDEENQTLSEQVEENQTLPEQDEENQTLIKQIITSFFGFHGKITNNSKFKHITDMFRCVHVETLPKQDVSKQDEENQTHPEQDEENQTLLEHDEENQTLPQQDEENRTLPEQGEENQTLPEQGEENQTLLEKDEENQTLPQQDEEIQILLRQYEENHTSIKHIYNADKLHSGGVKFKVEGDEFSLNVTFKNGCLTMPCFTVSDSLEVKLRNIIALEQCHYPFNLHVCNYIHFLDHFIDTEKDIDLLVEKGIIKNLIGEPALVARMVNKLGFGVSETPSYYSDIADEVNTYYSNPVKGSMAILKRVYFGNLWTGTATIAATFLLLMTLIQTVASIIQVMQNAS